ncbi:MAG: cation:proton antiporter [Aestuariibacter sp.]
MLELQPQTLHIAIFGLILLLGLATDVLAKRTGLPRVTLLLIFGMLLGEQAFGVLPNSIVEQFPLVSDMALLVIGFLLGGQFKLKKIAEEKKAMFMISAIAALMTTLLVTLVLLFTSLPFAVALLLGCIAAATAPAPIVDVSMEMHAKSAFSRLLLKVVAIDDIWAMLLFSLGIAYAKISMSGNGAMEPLLHAGWDIFGAILLGVMVGFPAAFLTGRFKPGQPTLFELLGLVFLCGGLAGLLQVSYLLSVMVMGAIIVNLAKHHRYAFHEIEHIEWPIMMLFFLLAGASMNFSSWQAMWVICGVYLVMRTLGKIAGGWVGGYLGKTNPATRNWIGIAMLPHAGVPIGMALLAGHQFPEYQQTFLTVIISVSVIFELVGPLLTRLAINKASSVKQ